MQSKVRKTLTIIVLVVLVATAFAAVPQIAGKSKKESNPGLEAFLLATASDYALAGNIIGILENENFMISHVEPIDFERYKYHRFIVVLGDLDTPYVGEVIEEILCHASWVLERLREDPTFGITKPTNNVWIIGQTVAVLSGPGKYLGEEVPQWRKDRLSEIAYASVAYGEVGMYEEISPVEVYENYMDEIERGEILLIDGRPAPMRQELGYIENDIHIPLGMVREESLNLDKNQQIIYYGGCGCCSKSATNILNLLGFKDVVAMAGGTTSWEKLGYPLIYD